jgi:hypothetical protein
MYTEILRDIDGVSVFPIVSLILFVVVFGAVLIRTAGLDRHGLDRLAGLPLDESPDSDEASHGAEAKRSSWP